MDVANSGSSRRRSSKYCAKNFESSADEACASAKEQMLQTNAVTIRAESRRVFNLSIIGSTFYFQERAFGYLDLKSGSPNHFSESHEGYQRFHIRDETFDPIGEKLAEEFNWLVSPGE